MLMYSSTSVLAVKSQLSLMSRTAIPGLIAPCEGTRVEAPLSIFFDPIAAVPVYICLHPCTEPRLEIKSIPSFVSPINSPEHAPKNAHTSCIQDSSIIRQCCLVYKVLPWCDHRRRRIGSTHQWTSMLARRSRDDLLAFQLRVMPCPDKSTCFPETTLVNVGRADKADRCSQRSDRSAAVYAHLNKSGFLTFKSGPLWAPSL